MTPFYWQKVARMWNNFWWEWEGSAKVRLHLNVKKTKIVTAKAIQNFNTDSGDTDIVKDFAYLGLRIHLNGDCSKEITGKAKTQKGGDGRIRKDPTAQRRVIGDQHWNHSHPRAPSHYVEKGKVDSDKGW